MSTLDEFQKRITRLEAEIAEVKKTLDEIVESAREREEELVKGMTPVAIGPPMPTVVVPTEEIVEEAVEEAHVDVKPVEEGAEKQEITSEDVGSVSGVLGKEE